MAQFVSPYSGRSLASWIEDVQQAPSADDRYRALLAVNSLGTPQDALHWCRHALADADSGVRALAAKRLGELKRQGVAMPAGDDSLRLISVELAARLTDADPDVRFEAARAMGQVDPQQTSARDVLISFLDDDGTLPLMLAVVVTALGERTDLDVEALIPRFRRLLSHSQAEVRENASAVVAQLKSAPSLLCTELLEALDDDEPIVRENAAAALGHCNRDVAPIRAALMKACEDEDEGVASAAREAHARLSPM